MMAHSSALCERCWRKEPHRKGKWALLPKDVDPAVYAALRAIYDSGRKWTDFADEENGIGQDTVRMWLYRNPNPGIRTVRRVLNMLGLDLAVVPKRRMTLDKLHEAQRFTLYATGCEFRDVQVEIIDDNWTLRLDGYTILPTAAIAAALAEARAAERKRCVEICGRYGALLSAVEIRALPDPGE